MRSRRIVDNRINKIVAPTYVNSEHKTSKLFYSIFHSSSSNFSFLYVGSLVMVNDQLFFKSIMEVMGSNKAEIKT